MKKKLLNIFFFVVLYIAFNTYVTAQSCLNFINGDLDCDGKVTTSDYDIWKEAYSNNDLTKDINSDGIINIFDYEIVRSHIENSEFPSCNIATNSSGSYSSINSSENNQSSQFNASSEITLSSASSSINTNNGWCEYKRLVNGQLKPFSIDPNKPLADPATGITSLILAYSNNIYLRTKDELLKEIPPYIARITDPKDNNKKVLRTMIAPNMTPTASDGTYRAELVSNRFEKYKEYLITMSFKIDKSWVFNEPNSNGLFFQTQSWPHKSGQAAHPSMSLKIYGDSLSLGVQYPKTAVSMWGGNITWTGNDYIPVSFPLQKLEKDKDTVITLHMFADDRPNEKGGKGFLKATINGKEFVDYSGPMLHPDQTDDHFYTFGWYTWQGKPLTEKIIDWNYITMEEKKDSCMQ